MCIKNKQTHKKNDVRKTHERALKGRSPAVSEQIVKMLMEIKIDMKVDPNFIFTQMSQFN